MAVLVTEEFPSADAVVEQFTRSPQPGRRARLDLGEPLDRDGFMAFCAQYPELLCELEPDGSVLLMSPQTLLSNWREFRVSAKLMAWWEESRYGEVLGSNAGFTLPDGSVRSPDAAWVSPERMAQLETGEFNKMGHLVPDFLIEVRSKSDRLSAVQQKMSATWMPACVRLAWLIDVEGERVFVYRTGVAEPEELRGFERTLSATAVVPDFVLDLRVLSR